MAIEEKQILKFFNDAISIMTQHTIKLVTKVGESMGNGSSVLVSHGSKRFCLTCSHVVKNAEIIFPMLNPMNSPIDHDFSKDVAYIESKVLFNDEVLDLALLSLDFDDNNWKKAFSLSKESILNQETAKRNINTAAFIHGIPAFFSEVIKIKDDKFSFLGATYSCVGPVVQVADNAIVADFAEKEELIPFKAKDIFPAILLSNGARDISGMSGSGIWMFGKEGFLFAGLLSRRAKENDNTNEHRIIFVPAWKIIEKIESI